MAKGLFLATVFNHRGVIKREGVFNQLGSIHSDTLCIQNLLDKQFPPIRKKRQWDILTGLFFYYGKNLCLNGHYGGNGVIRLPNGMTVLIERLNENDRRYKKCAIVEEYRSFFGVNAIKQHIDQHVTQASRKKYIQTHVNAVNKVFDKANCNFVFTAILC